MKDSSSFQTTHLSRALPASPTRMMSQYDVVDVFEGSPFLCKDGLVHETLMTSRFTENWTRCNRRCVGEIHQLMVMDVAEGSVPIVGEYIEPATVTCLLCLAAPR